jgi:hypothetical protein
MDLYFQRHDGQVRRGEGVHFHARHALKPGVSVWGSGSSASVGQAGVHEGQEDQRERQWRVAASGTILTACYTTYHAWGPGTD